MTSPVDCPVDVVRVEAAAIRRLLTDNLWSLELQKVTLEKGVSPLVDALWRTIGWSDDFAGDLGSPNVDRSRRAVQAMLADYQRWGSALNASALNS